MCHIALTYNVLKTNKHCFKVQVSFTCLGRSQVSGTRQTPQQDWYYTDCLRDYHTALVGPFFLGQKQIVCVYLELSHGALES